MSSTNLRVLTDGTAGVYSQVTQILFEFREINVTARQINKQTASSKEYIFTVSASEDNVELLSKELRHVSGVISVKQTISLEEIVSNLSKSYPDIVGKINDISKTIEAESRDNILRIIGAKLGQKFITLNTANASADCETFLSKAVVPMLSEFSICESKNNRVIISVCPFCRGQQSTTARCFFALGMIQGALISYPELKVKSVTETQCIAMKHESCEFTVTTV